MYFKFSTLFDKIWAIFICLLLFVGYYIAPLFIFTETDHIICNKNGQCKYYITSINNKERNIVKFNLDNIQQYACKPSKNKKSYLLISINNLNEENKITNHYGGYNHCNQLRLTLVNHDKNNELDYMYRPNPIKWYWLIFFIFGGLVFTPWIIFVTIMSFIKSKDIKSLHDIDN